jgi:hypothetical protein
MRNFALVFGTLGSLATFALPAVSAQTASDSVVLYALGPKSSFQYGCFAPCMCPVFSAQPLQGTFQLKHVGFDGLYENYEVSNVRWTWPENVANVVITGSGRYRIGGEFAVQKQMVLDLQFGDNPPQRFDSGLIAGEYDFPRIEIDVSLHQMTCFDSVIHVQAAPATASSVGSVISTPLAGSIRVTPNPFARETRLTLELPAPARVDLSIYDTQGRLVRRLARGARFPAGVQRVLWDGRRGDGSECASGVYFVRGRIGGLPLVQRIVKAR